MDTGVRKLQRVKHHFAVGGVGDGDLVALHLGALCGLGPEPEPEPEPGLFTQPR